MNATREGVRYLALRRREAQRASGTLGCLAREATDPCHMGPFYANLLLDPRICQWLRNEREVDARTAYVNRPGSAQLTDLIAKYYAYYHSSSSCNTSRYADDDVLGSGLAILARIAIAWCNAPYLVPGAAGHFAQSAVGHAAIRSYVLSPLEVDVLRRRGSDLRICSERRPRCVTEHLASLRQRYDRLYVPLHSEVEEHWMLAVAEREEDEAWHVYYIDSLCSHPCPTDVLAVGNLVGEVAAWHTPDVPIQANSVACGLHVLLATWDIAMTPCVRYTRWATLTTVRAEQLHAILLTILLNCLALLSNKAHMEALGVYTLNVPCSPRVSLTFDGVFPDKICYPTRTQAYLRRQGRRFQCYLRQRHRPSLSAQPYPVLDLT